MSVNRFLKTLDFLILPLELFFKLVTLIMAPLWGALCPCKLTFPQWPLQTLSDSANSWSLWTLVSACASGAWTFEFSDTTTTAQEAHRASSSKPKRVLWLKLLSPCRSIGLAFYWHCTHTHSTRWDIVPSCPYMHEQTWYQYIYNLSHKLFNNIASVRLWKNAIQLQLCSLQNIFVFAVIFERQCCYKAWNQHNV